MILKDSLKGKKIISILIILMLAQISYAELVLSVDLTVDKNDSVTMDRLKIENGRPTFYQPQGNYYLVILGEQGETLVNKSISLRFQRQMNPPIPIDHSDIIERITYSSDMDTLQIYHLNKLIFIASVDICDSDNVCDSQESSASCPQDCPQNKPDNVCNPNKNGICDPDCLQGMDPDCGGTYPTIPDNRNETTTTQPYTNQTTITNACGNKVCEPSLRENTTTCPQDCPQPTQTTTNTYNKIIELELTIILLLIITNIWYYKKTRKI